MDKAAEKKKSDKIALTICFLLAVMVWGVFGQTLRHEFVNYDDDLYVYDNPVSLAGITLEGTRQIITHRLAGGWAPLTSLSHMLDCQIYGLNPGGHHRTNVLLHMMTVLLLFLVLRQMTGSLWRSAFVAAVFAIHPLRVESVAWISERKDVLSGFFFMLTLGAYLRYVRRPFSIWRNATVAVLFALGLISKPMLVTLPFVLLLLDFWPLKRFQTLETKKPAARLILEKTPLFLLSAAFCGVTLWAERGALSSETALTVPWRFGNAFCSYAIYIKQLIFPAGLAPLYPHQRNGLLLWKIGASVALLVAISWGVFAGRKKYPYLITGWLWYLGMLVPVIGIMQVGSQAHADRYTYLPQIGLVIMATWLTADWFAALRYRRAVLSAAAATVLAVLAIAAHGQTRYWRDSFSLWTRTLACTDGNYLAHNNLGLVFDRRGLHDEAGRYYRKSIEINPHFSEAYNNLGVVLEARRRLGEAVGYYEKALEINPDYAEAHSNLGSVFAKLGQIEKAVSHLERTLEISPNLAEAHNNLGSLFGRQGQFDKAIPHFEKALEIKPDYAEAHYNLGMAFEGIGKLDAALEHYGKALVDSNRAANIHNRMGGILIRQGQPAKALPHFEAGTPYHESGKEP